MKKVNKKMYQNGFILGVSAFALVFFALVASFTFINLNNQKMNDNPIATPENSESLKEVRLLNCAAICSTGDILLHEPILKACYDSESRTYNFDNIFRFITPYVKKFDYAAINFEGTIGEKIFSGYPCFKYPESIVDSAKKGGFSLFLTANNHSNDGGVQGFYRTTRVLDEKGVDFTGTRQGIDDKKYFVKDVNGIKFGMVDYTYGEINESGIIYVNGIPGSKETSKLINVFDYEKLESFYKEQQDIINKMKQEGAEVIIYYMHWGNEYETKQSMAQVKIAQRLCDLGVDVIIGGHPHVIQPLDVLHSDVASKDTICLYSMGNAISNQLHDRMDLKTGHTEDGVLFGVSFEKYSNGNVRLSDISVLPTWTRRYIMNQKIIYQIVPLDKETDFNENFNLIYGNNDVESANRSYARTMKLLSPGLQKSKSLINSTLQQG